jgi:hypothetical protein
LGNCLWLIYSIEQQDIEYYLFCRLNLLIQQKRKKEQGNKALGCPKCIGPLEVAPEANVHFAPHGHFDVRLATQTDARDNLDV